MTGDAATIGLRERKKEQTRVALVESALRQFAERGFDHVTVEDIANDCEVSPRTFFRYFATKDDVLFGGPDSGHERLLAAVVAQPPERSAFGALEAAILETVAEFGIDREAMIQRRQIIRSTPSLHARATERYHGWEGELVDELRAAGRADHLTELQLRLTVAATVSALRVAVEQWTDDPWTDLSTVLVEALAHLRTGLDP